MRTFRGRKAMVTGAARGIGRCIAMALAKEGCSVWLVDLESPELHEAAEQVRAFGVEAVAEACDLTQPEQISRCVGSVLRRWGMLHILVNNAGYACYGPVRLLTAEHWARTMAVNLLAPIQLIRELLPTLEAQEEAHILNIASLAGLVAVRKLTAYTTTKHGLVGLTQALRADLRRTRVGASVLCPGFTQTRMIRESENLDPKRPAGELPAWVCTTPEHVAKRAIQAIRRNRGLVTITPMAKLLYGLWRLSPRVFDLLRKYL